MIRISNGIGLAFSQTICRSFYQDVRQEFFVETPAEDLSSEYLSALYQTTSIGRSKNPHFPLKTQTVRLSCLHISPKWRCNTVRASLILTLSSALSIAGLTLCPPRAYAA